MASARWSTTRQSELATVKDDIQLIRDALTNHVAKEEVGDKVDEGGEVAVIEAMKMENILKSQRAGRVFKVRAKAEETLAVGQVVVEFE